MTYKLDSTSAKVIEESTELLTNTDQSIFRLSKQAYIDSAKILGQDYDVRKYMIDQQFRIIKELDFGQIHFYDEYSNLHGDIFHYCEKTSAMRWDIQEDTLTIHGFLCQKASLEYGNRVWEAWFCPDVPIEDGPYKFHGLPGLIVQITDHTGTWRFDLLRLEKVPSVDFVTFYAPLFTRAKDVGKVEYYKQKRWFLDNSVQINETEGLISFPDNRIRESYYNRAKDRAAKDNNWIELHP